MYLPVYRVVFKLQYTVERLMISLHGSIIIMPKCVLREIMPTVFL